MIQKLFSRIYMAGLRSVQMLTLLLMGGLTLCSLLWGYYAEDMGTQVSIAHSEPFLLYIPCMLVLVVPLILLLRFFYTHNAQMEIKKALLLGMAFCWICMCGIFLILFGRSIPSADSASVFSIAETLALGHTQVIHPTESYLSYYPQQIGLIAFYEIILRIWNLLGVSYSASYIIQCVNVGMACVIVYFQYNTTCLLFQGSDNAAISYIFLAMLNAPLIVYTSFVYGEIPSFAFLSGGLYLLLKYLKSFDTDGRRGWITAAGCLSMLTASVALRKNSLIVIIAAVLVLLWEWLASRRHRLLLFGALLILCSVFVLPAIQHIYEQRAGNTLCSGVPAISYVAMGMQESSRGNGWYRLQEQSRYLRVPVCFPRGSRLRFPLLSGQISVPVDRRQLFLQTGHPGPHRRPPGYGGIHILRANVKILYSLLQYLSPVGLCFRLCLPVEAMAWPQIRRSSCQAALLYGNDRRVGRLFVPYGLGGQFPLYPAVFSAHAALCGMGAGNSRGASDKDNPQKTKDNRRIIL